MLIWLRNVYVHVYILRYSHETIAYIYKTKYCGAYIHVYICIYIDEQTPIIYRYMCVYKEDGSLVLLYIYIHMEYYLTDISPIQ